MAKMCTVSRLERQFATLLLCLLSRRILWIFFSCLPGNFALKNGGDFWWIFSGLRLPRNEAWKILEKFGENSEQNSGQNPGRKFEKFGKFSFCNFPGLTHCTCFTRLRGGGAKAMQPISGPKAPVLASRQGRNSWPEERAATREINQSAMSVTLTPNYDPLLLWMLRRSKP